MKPFSRRKASKITLKNHHKDKEWPKDEIKKTSQGEIPRNPGENIPLK